MSAYFSSKWFKRLRAPIALALLVVCLLGTHWIGLHHGISHAPSSQSLELSTSDQDPLLQHGSASCHLFDALALAGFLPPYVANLIQVSHQQNAFIQADLPQPNSQDLHLYQSRAPPAFIL